MCRLLVPGNFLLLYMCTVHVKYIRILDYCKSHLALCSIGLLDRLLDQYTHAGPHVQLAYISHCKLHASSCNVQICLSLHYSDNFCEFLIAVMLECTVQDLTGLQNVFCYCIHVHVGLVRNLVYSRLQRRPLHHGLHLSSP